MTIEQIELRKILTQMLADNGINRETLIPFVREIIGEKIDVSVKRIEKETDLYALAKRVIEQEIKYEVRNAVREKIKQCFADVHVSIEMSERMNES